MKKIALVWGICVVLCFSLCGCGKVKSSISYTYSVETGDKVEIKLDSSDGYTMTSELPFVIYCGENALSQGMFITEEAYKAYESSVEHDENATLLSSGKKDGNVYVFWSYNDSEYNYAILIDDSQTGLILGNNVSEQSAKECFSRLNIAILH